MAKINVDKSMQLSAAIKRISHALCSKYIIKVIFSKIRTFHSMHETLQASAFTLLA